MAQEAISQSCSSMRAGNQARYVGQDEHILFTGHFTGRFSDAEIRAQRGEGIVANARTRGAGCREQA